MVTPPTIRTLDGYALLELNIPPLNTLNRETVSALGGTFAGYDQDLPLIIAGTGKAFSAGVDTKAFASYANTERNGFFDAITAMTAAVCNIKTPVIAAINGHALGGGLVLALCADYRIVAEGGHKFGLTEAQAGIPFPAGPTEIVKHELPAPLLRKLTLSSQIISAADLLNQNVFDEQVPAAALRSSAVDRAITIHSQPAFAAVKAQMRGPLIAALKSL